jgi:hypothetical protein
MPDAWEPSERDDWYSQTQAVAMEPGRCSKEEHLNRLRGPQIDVPGLKPAFSPPRRQSWPAAHKGLTAVYSLCAAAVIGAGVFALATSGPGPSGSPGSPPVAAAAAGGSKSSPASRPQAGVIAATQPAEGSTVTGTAKTAKHATKVRAVPTPDAAPSAATGPVPTATAASTAAAPVVTASTPVVTTTVHGGPTVPASPTVTLTPAGQVTCTVTDNAPAITATVTADEAGPGAESFYVDEDGAAGSALPQVIISVPGPLTAGAVVTGEGAANASMASCQVVAVAGNS